MRIPGVHRIRRRRRTNSRPSRLQRLDFTWARGLQPLGRRPHLPEFYRQFSGTALEPHAAGGLDRCQSHAHSLVNAKGNIWGLQDRTTQNRPENNFFFVREDGEAFSNPWAPIDCPEIQAEIVARAALPSPDLPDSINYNQTRLPKPVFPLPAPSPGMRVTRPRFSAASFNRTPVKSEPNNCRLSDKLAFGRIFLTAIIRMKPKAAGRVRDSRSH
jgi:hypothetical protein